MQHEGRAILGIFLATYSSKGDYLPLRYPVMPHDYECAEMLLRNAETRCYEAAATDQVRVGDDADDAGSDTNAGEPPSVDMRNSFKDLPSRAGSYTSIGNANINTSTPVSAGPPSSAGATGGPAKVSGRGDSRAPRGGQISATDENSQQPADVGSPVPGFNRDTPQRWSIDQKINGFDPMFLAQLFSPRPSMSDQRFQVAIDNVLFIGHPLRDDRNVETLDPDYYDIEPQDAETVSRLTSMTENDDWKVKPHVLLPREGDLREGNLRETNLLEDLGLVNLVLNREPSEAGDSAISAGEREVRDSKEWKRRGYRKRVYPKLFHVVFMLDNTAPGIEALADRLYDHVLKRLTKTLMIEQMEANYVLSQSQLIRSLNDQAESEKYSPAKYLQEILKRSKLATNLIELYHGLYKGELVNLHVRRRIMLSLQIPRGPPLDRPQPSARPRLAFSSGYGVTGYGSANAINGSNSTSMAHTPRPATPLDASASVSGGVSHGLDQRSLNYCDAATQTIAPDVQEYWGPNFFDRTISQTPVRNCGVGTVPTAHGSLTARCASSDIVVNDRELQPGELNRYPRIEPYHAILLLEDVDALRRRLFDSDASPTLLVIIERAQPTESLSELHTKVDCSFAQLCRFVAHLVYWGVAKLICPIKPTHTYIPTAQRLTAALMERLSGQHFSLCTLPQLLARLHPPRPAELVLKAILSAAGQNAVAEHVPEVGSEEAPNARARDSKAEFREMLAFLLREGVIAQYHTWPTLLVPNYVKFNISEEVFVRLSLGWFCTLHAEHPDLLGAFPQALLDKAEYESWQSYESREKADAEMFRLLSRGAENRMNLCRVMRKLAVSRVREAWSEKKRGKHGQELSNIERKMEAEERKVHEFCNRIENDGIETLVNAQSQYRLRQSQTRQELIQDRRAHGKDIPEDLDDLPTDQLYKWYDYVRRDFDLSELTQEIVSKYVSYVPTDGPPQRTDAEKRYIAKLVEGRPTNQQEWFHRNSHLFTGSNHLVKLFGAEKAPLPRMEAILREFGSPILLPQHI
ncbi:Nitrogen permease regulator 3 [Coemansia linderi]|uniref:Nitrogen permease regulator 3 n=1 Tax=Coemansia linderi TaxID=2663919 RepID=A0ACC1KLN2_9FUNG|nr:Nitrogen permease regulator 3 [Coemansia linderi]